MNNFNDHKHAKNKAKVVSPSPQTKQPGTPKSATEAPAPQKISTDKKQVLAPKPSTDKQSVSGAHHSDVQSPSADTAKKEHKVDKSNQPTDNTMRQQKQQKQFQRTPQQQPSPTIDVIKAKWQKNVGAAKVAWGKLTDDEILQCEGQADKLAGLVRERYAIGRHEADKQVKEFLDKCKS